MHQLQHAESVRRVNQGKGLVTDESSMFKLHTFVEIWVFSDESQLYVPKLQVHA